MRIDDCVFIVEQKKQLKSDCIATVFITFSHGNFTQALLTHAYHNAQHRYLLNQIKVYCHMHQIT